VAIRIRDPDPHRDTGKTCLKTCLGGAMHRPSGSSSKVYFRLICTVCQMTTKLKAKHVHLKIEPMHLVHRIIAVYGSSLLTTRHRASTSLYSLTFLFRVTTPPQYGRNGTAHAAGASILSRARGVFVTKCSAWHCVRRAVGLVDYRWALPRISSVAIATQPVHRLQIRPIVHN